MHFKELLVDFSFELYTQCLEKQRESGNPPLRARVLGCRGESNEKYCSEGFVSASVPPRQVRFVGFTNGLVSMSHHKQMSNISIPLIPVDRTSLSQCTNQRNHITFALISCDHKIKYSEEQYS